MAISLERLRSTVNNRKAESSLLQKSILEKSKRLSQVKQELDDCVLSQQTITEIAKRIQLVVKKYIESLVTKAVAPVFDRPFKFVLEYDVKGRKTVAQPLIVEGDGEPQIPKEEMGVSILDILSFAFRIVLWRLERPRSRAVMWMDEPMRDVGKGKFLERAADMLREISQRLGLQLIIITHEQELARIGDAVFQVSHDGTASQVEVESESAVKKNRVGGSSFKRIEL